MALAEGQAGDLRVRASESVELVGNPAEGGRVTGIFNEVLEEATGEGGILAIETERLIIRDGAQVSTTTFGSGRGVDMQVRASEFVQVLGTSADSRLSSGLFTQVESEGNGSTLTIETGQLIVKDGALVSSDTLNVGDAGNIEVIASELIQLEGRSQNNSPSGLFTQVAPSATGNAGNLTVNTGQLIVLEGAQISTAARNSGRGGSITIDAEAILLSGTGPVADAFGSSGIFVSAEPGATNDAGRLNVTTGQLTVEEGAKISADNIGTGGGASVTLNVERLLIQSGGQVGAGSLLGEGAVDNERGPGGTITVNANDVEITGTGTIGSTPVRSSLFTRAEGTGDAGNLIINTENFSVEYGADLTAQSQGTGNAGRIIINASNTLNANDGDITTAADQSTGGAINITAGDIRLRGDGDIRTNVLLGAGGGGNITLEADSIIAFDDSDIFAFSRDGRGGNITLDTPAFFAESFRPDTSDINPDLLEGNDRIDINASGAVSGAITLPDVSFIQNSLAELPQNPIDPATLLATSCIVRGDRAQSSFTVTGSGGLPSRPEDAFVTSFPIGAIQTIPPAGESEPAPNSSSGLWQEGDPIIEPTGVYRLPSGQLVISRECS